MKICRLSFFILVLLLSGTLAITASYRGPEDSGNKLRISGGWEFYRGDLGSVWEALRTGRPAELPVWEPVTLPHSYNALDAVDADVAYYEGPAWYRTQLPVDNPHEGGRTLLHFEGAGQKTRVWVYDILVGEHVGGYDEFTMDLTDALEAFRDHEAAEGFKGKVPVSVRVDNSRDVEMIPSDLSDFNVYGGLYRYVNLQYVPAVSIGQLHITPHLSDNHKKCRVKAEIKLYNPGGTDTEINGRLRILSPGGKQFHSEDISIPAGEGTARFEWSIKTPELWSPASPVRYTAEFEYTCGTDQGRITERFGVRSFEFVKKGPFLLNGQRLLLRGTHRHEDHAGVGPAMTEDMIWKEMRMMKAMGVNFIRLGHYQQSRIVLEACDELGILVWEEIPWCRGGLGGESYREQARRMLGNMISQHHNHPSVIIWGLGNENDWPGDFDHFEEDSIRTFMKELNSLAHELDPTRKTAIRRCDFCKDIVDVYSPSIWAGWYRGKYTDYREVSRTNMEEVDHFLHVEWGASHHARRHSEDPDLGLESIASSDRADERDGDFLMSGGQARVSRDGDWTESYAVNLIDWHLKEQEKMDWLTGTAYWPFKDFSTPLRPENPLPYINQKGVVERDLTPKESFYVFQSYWTGEPMIHIYGHSWPVRWSTGEDANMVKVYSNCPTAELFLNGVSQGSRTRDSQDFPAAGLRWMVEFSQGKNELYVRGEMDGQVVEDRITVDFESREWGRPARFVLEEISRSGDTANLRASVFDVQGVPCLDAREQVRFALTGDGELIDHLGTSGGSNVLQLYNGRAEISVNLQGGNSVVSISAEELPTAFLGLESTEATAVMDAAAVRLGEALGTLGHSALNPRCLEENGEIRLVKSGDWTSGFFPGMLWMMYEYTRDSAWLEPARHYTLNVKDQQYNGGTHDMGFKMYCSFGNGYRLTRDPGYREILLQSARTLCTRYNPTVGSLRSWDHNADKWDFPVIIDNMMNLELLFWASRETRDPAYYNIAFRHAETTLENHFREDMSCYHVISYDTLTGEPVKKHTHQGYSHESAWARGQAWGLYGFTMTYRETGDERFLNQARAIAGYILDHPNLPADKIAFWDFDDPAISVIPGQPDIPRDASAAAVMASALYELSTYGGMDAEKYRASANQILDALSSDYRCSGEQALLFLLDHSTGNMPKNDEIDVPIIYADYYYLEALLRRLKLSGSWEGEKSAVIIKVDDLRADKRNVVPERWSKFTAYMEEQEVPAAIGLICESLKTGGQDYYDWIIQKQESGLFEFWNHGLDHSRDAEGTEASWEFENRSRDEQSAHLLESQALAREHLGFYLLTFGAPYNRADQTTADILEEIPEIEHWLYPPAEVSTTKNRLERVPGVNIEYPHQTLFLFPVQPGGLCPDLRAAFHRGR